MLGTLSAVITYGQKVINLTIGIIKGIYGIVKSKNVADELGKFIDQFKNDKNLRKALSLKIENDYRQAPEFFNSTINDNLEKLGLFDPYEWGLYILHSRPRCTAPSGNCGKEHLDWINRVYTFAEYIKEISENAIKSIKEVEKDKKISFNALGKEVQLKFLENIFKDSEPPQIVSKNFQTQKAGFSSETMLIIAVAVALFFVLQNKNIVRK